MSTTFSANTHLHAPYCKDSGNVNVKISSLTHEQLHCLVTSKCHKAYGSTKWACEICLPLYPFETGMDLSKLFDGEPTAIDLCSYLNDCSGAVTKLYLDPKKYPPIKPNDSKDEKKIKLDAVDSLIKKVARESGCPVVIGKSENHGNLRFRRTYLCEYCNCNNFGIKSSAAASAKSTERSDMYRDTHLVNDNMKGRRKGSGKGGKGLIRRTHHALLVDQPCPFVFTKKVDEHGFYISLYGGGGNRFHVGHPRFDPRFVPSQLSSLTQEEKEDVKHVLNATVSNGNAREFIIAKFGTFLSTAQINYLNSCASDDMVDEYSSLIDQMEKGNKIRFIMLWTHKRQGSEEVEVLSTTKITGEVSQHTPLLQDDEKKMLAPVAANARARRKGRAKQDDENQVFHLIAWCYEDVLRYFLLNPEVIMFDVTSHTNGSGFCLLTFSCRTSIDKQVVFCRVWMPDQRRVSFRYVFQEALMKLLPAHARKRVRFTICDGDPQQNMELRISIPLLFPHAKMGGCSFHLFVIGWNRHVFAFPRYSNQSKRDAWNGFKRRMLAWMFSWARPGHCDTKEEYEISKHLLLECLTSKHALAMAGGDEYLIASVVTFVKKSVFTNESAYLHSCRSDAFCLDAHCSSPHEGTNNGLKTSPSAPRADNKLNKAATAMTNQDRTRSVELDHIIGSDFRNRVKPWSTSPMSTQPSPTSTELLSHAEGLMQYMYKRAKSYSVRRIGYSRFQVVFTGKGCDHSFVRRYIDDWEVIDDSPVACGECAPDITSDSNMSRSPSVSSDNHRNQDEDGKDEDAMVDDEEEVPNHDDLFTKCCWPKFSHVYIVDLNASCTVCNCNHFLRAGFPCPHMTACAIAVCKAMGLTFEGFKHDSVRLRWWTNYMYYAYRTVESVEEEHIVKLFHHLAQNDVPGPKFHGNMPSETSMPIKEAVKDLPALQRVKNYPQNVLSSIFHDHQNKFDGLLCTTHRPSSSELVTDITSEEQEFIIATVDELRDASSDSLEMLMDSAHQEQMHLFEIESAVKAGASYRAALYPLFNEFTDLLQQLNSVESGKKVEMTLKVMIDDLAKQLAAQKLEGKNSATSPVGVETTSPGDVLNVAGAKRSQGWTSIQDGYKYKGPSRVKVSHHGKY